MYYYTTHLYINIVLLYNTNLGQEGTDETGPMMVHYSVLLYIYTQHLYNSVDIYSDMENSKMNANNMDWEQKYLKLEEAQIDDAVDEDDREWLIDSAKENIRLWREDAKKYDLTTVVRKEMTPTALRFAEENPDAVYLHTVLDAQGSVLHDVFWTVRGSLQVQPLIGADDE